MTFEYAPNMMIVKVHPLSDDKYITTKDEWLTSNYVIKDSFWVQDKDWC